MAVNFKVLIACFVIFIVFIVVFSIYCYHNVKWQQIALNEKREIVFMNAPPLQTIMMRDDIPPPTAPDSNDVYMI